ncbi:MAG TPA: recombination protein RecR [Elusimicrobia bacterium]|nr:MAG: recombination protein RecR [Elusimicrobia bacterium RIFOXYA12_FULL_49_49]OGS09915.1 MAG: recombination protein RecR [Elusimicrobia bacterium RIFOXYB1_FULL_48_9]OGS15440.1 MAG: recombination protein RecR [Elusimicrobia bacterium RIFOXYA2_FULL_47_53]OGS30867.1 MAG: recombination protein RecR [Elusimicrobia bacterium RIFOXYB2_FULL_46_23]HBU69155.1 recombination protein RecR [Elusimicrobiota bacterium]
MNRPQAIERLIESLRRLPGVGPKMAERLSYFLLKSPQIEVNELIEAIRQAKDSLRVCARCYNLSEKDPCAICTDPNRAQDILCIVETPQDLLALSQVKNYNGLYFVLGGALSPLDGVGPGEIRVRELINRLKKDKIQELIIATDTDSKGETTALYLAEQIKPLGIRVTRLGYGLPVGGDLEYADEITLSRALEGRREML